MAVIAWIGLGQMGQPMAAHLVNAGHLVRGVEPNPAAADAARELGVEIAGSVADAVSGADAVFTMLPDGRYVEKVLTGPDGVFQKVSPETVVIDCSTTDIATCRRMHEAATQAGIGFVDAPVSGGVTGAKAGTLTLMVGGEEAVFSQVRPLLQHVGAHIVHLGQAGAGQATKIVNNLILGVCLAATCEGILLAERLGVDAAALFEIVTRSSGDNWALRTWCPAPGVVETAPSSHNYAPGFKTSLLVKDLGLALAAGKHSGSPLDVTSAAHRVFADAMADGSGDLDCTSLLLSLRKAIAEEAFAPEAAR